MPSHYKNNLNKIDEEFLRKHELKFKDDEDKTFPPIEELDIFCNDLESPFNKETDNIIYNNLRKLK